MKTKQLFVRVAALTVSGTMHGQDIKPTRGNSLSNSVINTTSTRTGLVTPISSVCAHTPNSGLFTSSFIYSMVAIAAACTYLVVPPIQYNN